MPRGDTTVLPSLFEWLVCFDSGESSVPRLSDVDRFKDANESLLDVVLSAAVFGCF